VGMDFEPDYRFVCVVSHSCHLELWCAPRKAAGALPCVACAQYRFLSERRTDQLQSDRHPATVNAARHRHPGQPGEVHRYCEDVGEIHLERIVRLFAEPERGGWCDRSRDQVAALKGTLE